MGKCDTSRLDEQGGGIVFCDDPTKVGVGNNLKKISFIADKVDVGKKRIDGTRVVSCDVGEYQYQELAKILLIPDQTNVKVILEYEE